MLEHEYDPTKKYDAVEVYHIQAMIQKCQNGEIDMVLTKSISRFARNTLDTLQYVRMLRERNIAII